MRLLFGLLMAAAWCGLAERVHADPADESLRLYAVNILHDSSGPWDAVYLGRGLILSAAHVVNSATPVVRISGVELPAKVVKIGEYEQVDLALLSVDEERLAINLRLRRMPLCQQQPRVGQQVIVAVPARIVRSRIMSPNVLAPSVRARFSTLIGDVATTGNSGSGVFDANRKCLMGIMSRKFQTRPPSGEPKDIAKYFVPASTIAAFIPSQYRF